MALGKEGPDSNCGSFVHSRPCTLSGTPFPQLPVGARAAGALPRSFKLVFSIALPAQWTVPRPRNPSDG